MQRGREIELKLEVDAGGARLLHRHPLLKGAKACAQEQVSTYFDTADRKLQKAGYSLRVRRTADRYVQTVKRQSAIAAGLFERPEWEQTIADERVDLDAIDDTPLGALLTAKARARLAPLVRTEFRRTVWNLMQGDNRIELALDEGLVTGGRGSHPISELELELKAGDSAVLIALARALAGQVPLRLGVLSKVERGYALASGDGERPAKAERIALDPRMTVASGFAAIASACLRHFRLNEPLMVARQDPAALHQARVAVRRLRSAFTLFRPVIRDAEFARLRGEVRWLADALGDARNLDVLIRRLPADKGGAAGAALRLRLHSAREQAYAHAIAALGTERQRRLMLDLVAWLEAGQWRTAAAAAAPLSAFAARRLDKRWRAVKQGGRSLTTLDPDPLHRLRIEGKKLRYAIEFLAGLDSGKNRTARRKAFLAALEEIQERLGDLNDVETAHRLLARLVGNGKPAAAMLRYADRALDAKAASAGALDAAEAAFGRLLAIGPFWR